MQVTIKHLLSAALLAGFVVSSQASPALANYDAGDARHDQGIINRLAAEGAINPNQTACMDQRAINRANGSWWHRNMSPMMTGVPVNPMIGGAPMLGGVSMGGGGFLNRTQAHNEKRQVDQLLRDHAISPMQASQMKAQIDAEANGGYNNGMFNNAGYYRPGLFSSMAPAIANIAPGVVPGHAYPVNYYNNNNGNNGLWQRAQNYFHY